MTLKGAKVLVTGGTGFVGSHLVERLLTEGAVVTSTYQTANPQSYFFQKKLNNFVALSHTSVNNYQAIFDLVTKADIEYIFHLAAQPLVHVAYANPLQTLQTNIMGTAHILEAARNSTTTVGVIVASSDKAYGKLAEGKYTEQSQLKGDHPYEVSKSATDLLCNTYFKTYQTPVITTRFGNIYGAGDLNYSRIIPGVIKSILTKEPLVLRSDGSHIRDYLHVKDVVEGYILAAQKCNTLAGEAFNFGSTDTFSVLEILATCEKTLDIPIPYTIVNTAKNEIPYQSLDFSKAKKHLHWKPKQTLHSSLPEILTYYQTILHEKK